LSVLSVVPSGVSLFTLLPWLLSPSLVVVVVVVMIFCFNKLRCARLLLLWLWLLLLPVTYYHQTKGSYMPIANKGPCSVNVGLLFEVEIIPRGRSRRIYKTNSTRW
jgi:hypothetical protein